MPSTTPCTRPTIRPAAAAGRQPAAHRPGYNDQDQPPKTPAKMPSRTYADQPPPPLPEYDQPPAPDTTTSGPPATGTTAPAATTGFPASGAAPPYYGALWTPPYWGYYGGRYRFHRGYWGPHVGYYGGIDYGFGYIGIGYYGGYWRGNDFYYNRAVTNVNVSIIHNVYERTVVYNNVTYSGRIRTASATTVAAAASTSSPARRSSPPVIRPAWLRSPSSAR